MTDIKIFDTLFSIRNLLASPKPNVIEALEAVNTAILMMETDFEDFEEIAYGVGLTD